MVRLLSSKAKRCLLVGLQLKFRVTAQSVARRALMLAGRSVPWHVFPHTGTAALAYWTYRQSAACPLELKLDPRAKPRSRLDGQKLGLGPDLLWDCFASLPCPEAEKDRAPFPRRSVSRLIDREDASPTMLSRWLAQSERLLR